MIIILVLKIMTLTKIIINNYAARIITTTMI